MAAMKQGQIRKALIVGIDRYPFFKNSKGIQCHLEAPEKDATAIAHLLAEEGGFDPIISLPNSLTTSRGGLTEAILANRVRKVELERAIENFFNPQDNHRFPDVALFYFSGHGWYDRETKEYFLVTSDSNPQAKRNLLPLRWLQEQLDKSQIEQQVVLLDCCFSGGLLAEEEVNSLLIEGKQPNESNLAGVENLIPDRCLITACRPSQTAQEDLQNGFLTRKLLELLKVDPENHRYYITNQHLNELNSITFPNGQEPLCHNSGQRAIILTDIAFSDSLSGGCPYRSLNFFDVQDAHLFYGRTRLTDELIERVQKQHNLMIVTGASGSGKSSLLRAGLLSKLKKDKIPGSANWIYFDPFTPGDLILKTTTEQFAEFLNQITEQKKQELATFKQQRTEQFKGYLAEVLNDRPRGRSVTPSSPTEQFYEFFKQITEQQKQELAFFKQQRKLMIVDQFEECFTKIFNDQDRETLFNWLCELLDTNPELTIILGMRSDFRATLQKYPQLAKRIIKPFINVGYLNRDELEEVIVEPANQVGLHFDDALKNKLIDDVEDYPESLPLLEFTLTQLWEETQKPPYQRRLFLEDYYNIGRIEGTLNKQADKAYNSLENERKKEIARRIFLELIQIGENRDTRRKVRLQDLANSYHKFEELKEVALELAKAHLVNFDEDRQNPERTIINLTHEALLYHWEKFKLWKDELEIPMLIERRLEYEANIWRDNGRKNRDLLSEGQVKDAIKYMEDYGALGFLDEAAEDFIKRSKAHRAVQRNTRIALVLGVCSVISIFAVLAKSQEWVANIRKDIVRTNTQLADDPVQGLVSAIKFTAATQNNWWHRFSTAATDQKTWWSLFQTIDMTTLATDEVQPVLQNAINDVQELNRLEGHDRSINDVDMSEDGEIIVSAGNDQAEEDAIYVVKVWETRTNTGQPLHTLEGHTDAITDVVVSHDPQGKITVSGSQDRTARVWDTDSGKLLHILQHQDSVTDVVISQDGRTIVSGSKDGRMGVWDIQTGKLRYPLLKGHQDSIADLVISRDKVGKTIVSGSKDGRIGVWDARSGKQLHILAVNNPSPVTSIALTTDSTTIVSGGQDNQIRVWNTLTGKLRYNALEGHQGTISSVKIAPDDRLIASAAEDGAIRLWNLHSGKLTYTLLGHQASINMMTFSKDGKILVSAAKDKTIRLWDTTSGRLLDVLVGHTNPIEAIDFNSKKNILVSVSGDSTIRIWHPDLRTPQYLQSNKFSEIPVLSSVNAVATAPNSSIVAVGGSDNVIRLWDRHLAQLPKALEKHTGTIYTLAFSSDGKILSSGGVDGYIHLWDVTSRRFKKSLGNGSSDTIYTLAFNPMDTNQLASGGRDRKIWLWDIKKSNSSLLGEHDDSSINAIAFSADGQTLASADREGIIRLWNAKSKTPKFTLEKKHTGSITALAFHPKEKNILVSTSTDRTILVWDIDTGKSQEIPQLYPNKHTGSIQTIAFSPDGQFLASAGNDTTIRLWKEISGSYQFDRILGKHQAPVYSIAFSYRESSKDGSNDTQKILVSGGDDATVHYWPVKKPDPKIEPACQRLVNHPGLKDVEGICHKVLERKKIK